MLLVYGGAFNPPTKAHYNIAELLIKKYNCDFLFVPVGGSYNKSDMISFKDRFNMLKIIADKLNVKVLDLEDNDKFLGTYDLLNKLKDIDNDIYFIMGADNLININSWINSELLIKEFKFIILNRDNYDCNSFINKLSYPNNFTVIEVDYDISSTDFRLNKNTDIINNDVLKYIKENNLYEV